MPLPPRGASEKTQLAVAAENRRKEDLEREDFYDKLFELEQMSKNKKSTVSTAQVLSAKPHEKQGRLCMSTTHRASQTALWRRLFVQTPTAAAP